MDRKMKEENKEEQTWEWGGKMREKGLNRNNERKYTEKNKEIYK